MLRIHGTVFAGAYIASAIKWGIYLCARTADEIKPLPDVDNPFWEIDATGEFDDEGVELYFEFNGVTITLRHNSDPDLIYRDWSRALNGYIKKAVGPHPNPVLTDDEKANDDRIEAKNERRRQKRDAEYSTKLAVRTAALDAKLAQLPEMELADSAAWQGYVTVNSDGGYGEAVLRYAEKWARLMQGELAAGKTIEEIAASTSYEVADVEGITGFQYGCAVGALAQCWKHGEELRKWHNLKTQLGDEGEKANETGGVLNPALLSVGRS